MKLKPYYSDLLTTDFFTHYYINKKMSYPKIREMLVEQGYNIHVGTLHTYAKRLGIGRTISESVRTLDYNQSFLTEGVMESVDGFLLGDGNIAPYKQSARARCGVEHEKFCEYLMNQFDYYKPVTKSYCSDSMKSGVLWAGHTKFHPDLYEQYKRWYPDGGKKQPPNDVRITPKSVMMWYLGDGSVVQKNNAIMLRLSTDGFDKGKVEFLAEKLKEKGILCHRNGDNRIQVEARGIPAFFDFIGRKSPIECYNYKFELPEWRFESRRMKDVANELGVSYNRLSHLVKTGRLECYRASEKGRPRMMPEHIEKAKVLIASGDLY